MRELLSSQVGTRLTSEVAPVGGVRAASERLPHPPLAAVLLLTDEEPAAAVFCPESAAW